MSERGVLEGCGLGFAGGAVSATRLADPGSSTETTRFIRDGEKGGRGMEVGVEIIYLSLHCHHRNDFCIKVGSDESHFNVS